MAVIMQMQWDGVTREQYEAARDLVGWEGNVPHGAILHLAGFGDHGLRVTDVWESAEDFQRFVQERLDPGVKQLGIQGEPRVEIVPLHATFTPALERLTAASLAR